MSYSECEFRIATATYRVIVTHLCACADNFRPPLHACVRIEDYARKIFDKAITFEAWDEGKLVALIAAYFNDTEKRTAFITNVSVLGKYQGRGIASILMQHTIQFARDHGFIRLDLEVSADNTDAHGLYEKSGFAVIEQKRGKFRMSRKILTETPNGQ